MAGLKYKSELTVLKIKTKVYCPAMNATGKIFLHLSSLENFLLELPIIYKWKISKGHKIRFNFSNYFHTLGVSYDKRDNQKVSFVYLV